MHSSCHRLPSGVFTLTSVTFFDAHVVKAQLDSSRIDFTFWSEKRIQAYKDALAMKLEELLAVLTIPKTGIEVPVFEGTDDITLNRGTGRIAGTAKPGEPGNMGIAAHRDGFFRKLKDLQSGDRIELSTKNGALNAIHPPKATEDEKRVQRQAFAGLLWFKQACLFDVNAWLEGDNPNSLPPASRMTIRNRHWRHLNSMRVLSMPDKWEYPWFAAWDLAFHMVPFGQIPAYEWEFSDLNPPVHGWAV